MSRGSTYISIHMDDILCDFDLKDVLDWYKKDMRDDDAFLDILKDFVAREEEPKENQGCIPCCGGFS